MTKLHKFDVEMIRFLPANEEQEEGRFHRCPPKTDSWIDDVLKLKVKWSSIEMTLIDGVWTKKDN